MITNLPSTDWKFQFEQKSNEISTIVSTQLATIQQSVNETSDIVNCMQSEIDQLTTIKLELFRKIEQSREELETIVNEVANISTIKTMLDQEIDKAKYKVKLNVGGQIFVTSKTTLTKDKNSYFYGMISSNNWQPDEDGEYFIDRDPVVFNRILNYMRDGYLDVNGLSQRERYVLNKDLDYYCLQNDIPTPPKTITISEESHEPYPSYNADNLLNQNPRSAWGVLIGYYDPSPFLVFNFEEVCRVEQFLIQDKGNRRGVKRLCLEFKNTESEKWANRVYLDLEKSAEMKSRNVSSNAQFCKVTFLENYGSEDGCLYVVSSIGFN
eukprot:TRINITY_DN11818_c0_g1_i1.p1 TRINITY_DN11818_c0_g1~~TRINITY_DN11818_c0_g1_i1.p1  ORF type:complete len:324 (-),score=54.68 TRINITY_DN11818_c0_g1_i1:109-1080(-)